METKVEEFKQPSPFVRDSRLRKSFRIKNRVKYNPKLTPAAIIFMKSLDNKKLNISSPQTSLKSSTSTQTYTKVPKIHKINIEYVSSCNETSEESECSFEIDDDRRKLINKKPQLGYRNYFKKLQKKKQFLDFFKKN